MDSNTHDQKRIKVLTWHVHGGYLYYLTQANCDFYLPVNEARTHGYSGKISDDPLGDNVHEIPVEAIKNADFDVILFQSRQNYLVDQYEILSAEQRNLPKVYLEHEPPADSPADTRHFIDDPSVTLVQVTDYNRLMCDSDHLPTVVIEHGVVDSSTPYKGTLDRGIVVINNLQSRGRRLGLDIFQEMRHKIPLDLVGLGTTEIGGLGPIRHDELPEFMSQYRFFFTPARYSSLALSIIEGMMVGLPVVGVGTTELSSVFRSGVNGYISLKLDRLAEYMKMLLDSPEMAYRIGENGRQYALQRFSIKRFASDWERLFESVCEEHRARLVS